MATSNRYSSASSTLFTRSYHLLFILPFPFLFRERYLTRRIDECIASRYPGAHRSYGSFLILPSDSDEQELNNFVLPFKFPFFFLFSIVSYICRLFYFSMSHRKNISTSFLLYVYILKSYLQTRSLKRKWVAEGKKKKIGEGYNEFRMYVFNQFLISCLLSTIQAIQHFQSSVFQVCH